MSAPPMPPMLPDGQDMGANYYPPENDLTGGLPINLDSLRDGPPGSKPFYPYSTLIRYAIKGSPNQKLLLEDIYYAIESRDSPNGWKNSVRHNLSLNPCFEKVPRPLTDRGKGSYWTVNDNVDPRTGVHRIRKKKTKGKGRSSEDDDVDYQPPDGSFDESQYTQPQLDESGAPRPPPPFPFNPNFPMMDMRFPMPPPGPMPISPEENIELDENGNVNWRVAWLKEIGHLQQVTAEQEKANVDPEWYRMMLFRVRGALMPPINPDGVMVPPYMPPPGAPTEQQPPQS
ncbi:hypothetical protein C8R46DRAFT_1073620 [Mycena filopes]|nr:hypothetical protein C8R46DRAFT_1073620 [Mycena filopes]